MPKVEWNTRVVTKRGFGIGVIFLAINVWWIDELNRHGLLVAASEIIFGGLFGAFIGALMSSIRNRVVRSN
jgi:hypothetical protein